MRFHAFHGVYEAERKIGAEFIVDVRITTGVGKAVATDGIEHAVNYESVYRICRLEMDRPSNLIESVLSRIVESLKRQFTEMESLTVRIRKMNPPIGGRVDWASVESTQEFVADCPRCKSRIIRYNNDDCFQRFPNLHPATREMLAKQFGPRCLCDNCLKFYAG